MSLHRDCNFFVIARLKNGEDEIPEEILKNFKVIGVKKTGAWNIWEMDYRDELKVKMKNEGVNSWMGRKKESKNYRNAVYWNDLTKPKVRKVKSP